MSATQLPSFLPGTLVIERGAPRDYRELERFHYLHGRPATWAAVWVVRYADAQDGTRHGTRIGLEAANRSGGRMRLLRDNEQPSPGRLVAVAVLSYPTVNSAARDRALGIAVRPPREKLALVNRHVRTISRVIVHPQFRGLGLATQLVHHVCNQCPTRWVEAFAVMGRVHPFFEKGGMTPSRSEPSGPVYYWFDRDLQQSA